jgi:hypothetical protein
MFYMLVMPLMKTRSREISLQDAVRIKSAELWLKLGERGQAIDEMRRVPRRLWSHPCARPVVELVSRMK